MYGNKLQNELSHWDEVPKEAKGAGERVSLKGLRLISRERESRHGHEVALAVRQDQHQDRAI